ncbi:aceric acid hydrolase [Gaoshiqia sp. Z1-71]|uniref:aceric acid hydrolase n=1 Tax=Gaoshiqia hydrogeniformans TaxID=3290090 RepID=UPI003BF8A128
MKLKKIIIPVFAAILVTSVLNTSGQDKSLVNTSHSPFAKLWAVNMTDVNWTNGFWAERFHVCEHSMVPHMMDMYLNDSISHGFANFEIAAGLKQGKHVGPPFHDGDFYKILEAMIMVNSVNPDEQTGQEIDSIISVIAKTQRADGYIHTPVMIKTRENPDEKAEFAERLDFETYNMGHLMTAACVHYRLTGKKNLLDVAIKATDFLYNYYKHRAYELAQNAICPSHYMGVTEMYRTVGDPRYLELAKGLIDIRDQVENGTDDNQDRIPFRRQTKAMGHAVRANYLYAGAADVLAETGDETLRHALDLIWDNLTGTKMYITGACGALYDGVSPNGTAYKPDTVQKIHQAYGHDFELPNLSAHNESCANIGNLLWNWRMLQLSGDARYADIMEQVMYNSLLAAVSLDGRRHFYTNPLAVSEDLPYELRWSKDREEYISYCNCCPPNTTRTVAQIHNYIYSTSDEGLWVNFYGGNKLKTSLKGKGLLELNQETEYPWDGHVKLTIDQAPKAAFALFIRIPAWSNGAKISVNGKSVEETPVAGTYHKLLRTWKKGDLVEIEFPLEVQLMEAHPLVEETRNQVAVQRGPVVYCVESVDLPDRLGIFDVAVPLDSQFKPIPMTVSGGTFLALQAEVKKLNSADWSNSLYRPLSNQAGERIRINLIPYYAWNNRGKSDMSVWLRLAR